MKRYIKVNGEWIDTLEQQLQGKYYYVIENVVSVEYKVGELEEEKDAEQNDC